MQHVIRWGPASKRCNASLVCRRCAGIGHGIPWSNESICCIYCADKHFPKECALTKYDSEKKMACRQRQNMQIAHSRAVMICNMQPISSAQQLGVRSNGVSNNSNNKKKSSRFIQQVGWTCVTICWTNTHQQHSQWSVSTTPSPISCAPTITNKSIPVGTQTNADLVAVIDFGHVWTVVYAARQQQIRHAIRIRYKMIWRAALAWRYYLHCATIGQWIRAVRHSERPNSFNREHNQWTKTKRTQIVLI